MKNKIHNGMIILNKKNINKILDYFCFYSDTDNDAQYVAGMVGMMDCFGLNVYRKGSEWIMADFNWNELGRKTIDNLKNI